MPVGNKKIWKSNLKKAGEIYREKKLSQVRAVTLQALREVMLGSPVDTGRFRSNWMVSAGKRNKVLNETYHKDNKSGKKDQPVSVDELEASQKEIAKLGDQEKLYISNNLPYAQRLEEGHSSQNKGFFRRAKENAKARFAVLDDVVVK